MCSPATPLFPHKVTRYELTPEQVDCVVFCSKNYAPILPRLHEITDRFPTYFYYTITAYGRDIEPGVLPGNQHGDPAPAVPPGGAAAPGLAV